MGAGSQSGGGPRVRCGGAFKFGPSCSGEPVPVPWVSCEAVLSCRVIFEVPSNPSHSMAEYCIRVYFASSQSSLIQVIKRKLKKKKNSNTAVLKGNSNFIMMAFDRNTATKQPLGWTAAWCYSSLQHGAGTKMHHCHHWDATLL